MRRIRSALTVAGALGVMVLPVAAAMETAPAFEATTPPSVTATASPTPTSSRSAHAEFTPGTPSPQQPTSSPEPAPDLTSEPTSPPTESAPPTEPTSEPTPDPEPSEAPSTVPASPQPSTQPTEEVESVPALPQPSDEAQPLRPAPQQSTEEAQGAVAALSPWTLDSTFNSDRITGVITPPLAPVDSREATAVASGRLPASVLGLTNPQYVERQSYDGTLGWVEGFLNSKSDPLPRSDSSIAAGVVGAEAREGSVSAMPSGNVFERGIAIVSGSGPLVVFTGIAVCGLLFIVGNFMRQSRTDKR
ncbi:hypothetical protein [Rothia sp. (in: high G+C Gram-positive bacteria)]|uniref:hypothetical protein n=1 Tax=Rothia sp. (in: high G+C Gram-positive bacteria) TaxID=1885016 RepID=UPI000ED4088A|nr:hypothetical protein [Rothia sp. (in: high G+C Gram-positive bacteria)]